jgi:hypothetical protein
LRSASIAPMMLAVAVPAAFADVLIRVDKSTQRMSVSVGGIPRYEFVVSTGRPGYGTPSGTYHPQRMERSWFSREYYNSPMPHSIFFRGGYAIHGSYELNQLGGPASHGCIRLHPSNAAALFALVRSEGMEAATIVVSGSSPVSRDVQRPLLWGRTEPAYDPRRFNYKMPYGSPGEHEYFPFYRPYPIP